MTSQGSEESPRTPEIFTIFRLPTYEDAVKSSGEPPPYEQALTDRRVEDLEISVPEYSPRDSRSNQRRSRGGYRSQCQRRTYKCFCWGLAVTILLVLGYMIYMGIFRYLTNPKTDS